MALVSNTERKSMPWVCLSLVSDLGNENIACTIGTEREHRSKESLSQWLATWNFWREFAVLAQREESISTLRRLSISESCLSSMGKLGAYEGRVRYGHQVDEERHAWWESVLSAAQHIRPLQNADSMSRAKYRERKWDTRLIVLDGKCVKRV